ncbi:MAG: tRNA lysidine(34) synthetase TilS [Deltaproteobacteria bacterium]
MTRHPLTNHLAREIAGLPPPRRLLVAVSGGADSVALLRGLYELEDELNLALHVAHLDHQLRGQAARDDADWVERLCRTLGIPCTIGRANVAGLAPGTGRGIEETARDERHRFLEETATVHDCRAIALAHTADDQAETILHHILRGTGLSGLRGIPRERALGSGVRLVRPLLDVERSVVLDYLARLGQDYREDEANGDEAYTRNRIRHQLLPLLGKVYNPHIREALRRLGEQAAGTQSAIEMLAADVLERALDSSTAEVCRLKWQPLAGVPRHLVREMLAQLWRRQNWPRQKMGFEHWEELAEIALCGGAATFPGSVDARREGKWLVIRAAGVRI